jgi:RNAse (barnase) inhibitor barstar
VDEDDARVVFREQAPEGLADFISRFDVIASIHGARAITLEHFFREVSRGFAFPEYFGGNWPALDECLTDFEWLPSPSYLVLVVRADLLLAAESRREKERMITALERASTRWDEPALLGSSIPNVTFRSVLLGTTRDEWLAFE